jgi:hypothetical protein
VQGQVELALKFDRLPVHGHPVVFGVNLCAEDANRLAVHNHATVEDELLPGATRRHARFGEEFLQTNVQTLKG